jgi:hypothetical protein
MVMTDIRTDVRTIVYSQVAATAALMKFKEVVDKTLSGQLKDDQESLEYLVGVLSREFKTGDIALPGPAFRKEFQVLKRDSFSRELRKCVEYSICYLCDVLVRDGCVEVFRIDMGHGLVVVGRVFTQYPGIVNSDNLIPYSLGSDNLPGLVSLKCGDVRDRGGRTHAVVLVDKDDFIDQYRIEFFNNEWMLGYRTVKVSLGSAELKPVVVISKVGDTATVVWETRQESNDFVIRLVDEIVGHIEGMDAVQTSSGTPNSLSMRKFKIKGDKVKEGMNAVTFNGYTSELTKYGVTSFKNYKEVFDDTRTGQAIVEFYKEGILDSSNDFFYRNWVNGLIVTAGLNGTYDLDSQLVIKLDPVVIDGEKVYLVICIRHVTKDLVMPDECVYFADNRPRVLIADSVDGGKWVSRMFLGVGGNPDEVKGPLVPSNSLMPNLRLISTAAIRGDKSIANTSCIFVDEVDYTGPGSFSALCGEWIPLIFDRMEVIYAVMNAKTILVLIDKDKLEIVHNKTQVEVDILGKISYYYRLKSVSIPKLIEGTTLMKRVAYLAEPTANKEEEPVPAKEVVVSPATFAGLFREHNPPQGHKEKELFTKYTKTLYLGDKIVTNDPGGRISPIVSDAILAFYRRGAILDEVQMRHYLRWLTEVRHGAVGIDHNKLVIRLEPTPVDGGWVRLMIMISVKSRHKSPPSESGVGYVCIGCVDLDEVHVAVLFIVHGPIQGPTEKEAALEVICEDKVKKFRKLMAVNKEGVTVKDFGVVDPSLGVDCPVRIAGHEWLREYGHDNYKLKLRTYVHAEDEDLTTFGFGKIVSISRGDNPVDILLVPGWNEDPSHTKRFKIANQFLSIVGRWLSTMEDVTGNILFVTKGYPFFVAVVHDTHGLRSLKNPLRYDELNQIASDLGVKHQDLVVTNSFHYLDRNVVVLRKNLQISDSRKELVK